MKKSFLNLCTAAVLLISGHAAAQNVVRVKPSASQGFLLLNGADYPTVIKWDVQILKNTFTNGVAVTTLEKSELLTGKNYTSIGEEYYNYSPASNVDYSYTVTGLDVNNLPVTTFGPERLCTGCPPPDFEELAVWKCVGKRTAWQLKLWVDNSWFSPTAGHHFLVFDQASDHFSNSYGGYAIPYYEWATDDWKTTICNTPSLMNFYGLTTNNCNSVNAPGGNEKIITRHNVASADHLLDLNCIALQGNIYGVQKYLGPWASHAGQRIDIGNINVSNHTLKNLLAAIKSYNWFNFEENLICESCSKAPNWTNSGWWGTGFASAPWRQKLPTIETPANGNQGLWGLIGTISAYAGGGVYKPITGNVRWYENLKEVQISRVDAAGLDLRIEYDKLFRRSGQFAYPSIVMDPGLYRIEFIHKDQTGLPLYYQVDQVQNFSLAEKDFLKVNIYPVPITGNSFTLELEALADVNCVYTLYGNQGQVLETRNIILGKDLALSLPINGTGLSSWPAGTLIHNFTFNDGSVLSIPTIKL